MAKIKSEVSQAQPRSAKWDTVQHASGSEQQALQQTAPGENRVVQGIEPDYPSWPTSKPGPQSTLPRTGTRSINAFRPEQVVEIGYDRETGESSVDSPQRSVPDVPIHGPTSFDQPRNAQDALGKRKERL
jgi:hypothetical protein